MEEAVRQLAVESLGHYLGRSLVRLIERPRFLIIDFVSVDGKKENASNPNRRSSPHRPRRPDFVQEILLVSSRAVQKLDDILLVVRLNASLAKAVCEAKVLTSGFDMKPT